MLRCIIASILCATLTAACAEEPMTHAKAKTGKNAGKDADPKAAPAVPTDGSRLDAEANAGKDTDEGKDEEDGKEGEGKDAADEGKDEAEGDEKPSKPVKPVKMDPVTLTAVGHGEITSVDDKYDMHKHQTIVVDDANISVNTTKVYSSKDKVTEKLQNSLGLTVATRLTYDETHALSEKKGFAYSQFAFYVNRIQRVGKTDVTLSNPAPYFAIPAPYGRYTSLAVGKTLTTTTTISGNGAPYEAIFKVTRHADAGPKVVVVEIAMEIPSDKDGKKYEIGVPHRSIFVIDTEARRVTSLKVEGFYYSDRAPGNPQDQFPGGFPGGGPGFPGGPNFEMFSKRQPLYLNNCITSETRKGKLTQYPCP